MGMAGVAAARVLWNDGCPARSDLVRPTVTFEQVKTRVTVTLANPNRCWGMRDQPVQLDLYGTDRAFLMSYLAGGVPHRDVGICCVVTLAPRARWSINLRPPFERPAKIGDVQILPRFTDGQFRWTRMPEVGDVIGSGSPPPPTPEPSAATPLPDDAH